MAHDLPRSFRIREAVDECEASALLGEVDLSSRSCSSTAFIKAAVRPSLVFGSSSALASVLAISHFTGLFLLPDHEHLSYQYLLAGPYTLYMMAFTQTLEMEATWTAYPSLLGSLNVEYRDALEEAVCAGQCGRYQDAAAIYDTRLPKSHTMPVLSLNHADMLTSQGREWKRMKMLRDSLQEVFTRTAPAPTQLLMQLMLVDAEFWTLGKRKPVLQLLPLVRAYFVKRKIDDLTDIEIRLITMFHGVVNSLVTCCNDVAKLHQTAFPMFLGDRAAEISCIRKVLQEQSRWRFAPTMMQSELSRTEDLRTAVQTSLQICTSLGNAPQDAIKFRQVVLSNQIAEQLATVRPDLSLEVANTAAATLAQVSVRSHSNPDSFCPLMALEARKKIILQSDKSQSEKMSLLRDLLADATKQENYTKMNQLYMTIRDLAVNWQKQNRSAVDAAQQLRAIREGFVNFHQITTGIAYFEGAALCDYLTDLSVENKDYDTILSQTEDFESRHQAFEIPSVLERLYDVAYDAAKARGRKALCIKLSRKHRDATEQCHFYHQGGGLTDEAISNPDYAHRFIAVDGTESVTMGLNSMRLMLRWAAHETDKGMMSKDNYTELFAHVPSGNTRDTLLGDSSEEQLAEAVCDAICGLSNKPADTNHFLHSYQRLLDWILIDGRLPSKATRIYALKIFLRFRLHRYGQYLIERAGLPEADHAEIIGRESEALIELSQLEASETGIKLEQDEEELSMRIQTTLVKSFVANSATTGLITDLALELSIGACHQLIARFQERGAFFKKYQTICQLLRLTWQRYVKFRSIQPMEVIPIAFQAERLYVQTRDAIKGPDASSDLIARAKLSQDFTHREHYNFAFAALCAAYENKVLATEFDSKRRQDIIENLAQWSLLSKGRGLLDILQVSKATKLLQTGIHTPSVPFEQPESQLDEDQNRVHEIIEPHTYGLTLNEDKRTGEFHAKGLTGADITHMLNSIPHAVAIVDFIALEYREQGPSLAALVYRQNLAVELVVIPVAMDTMKQWIMTNLDSTEDSGLHPLQGHNAAISLDSLEILLRHVVGDRKASIIEPGDTVVLCPTGHLNRIPIHAIPVDGKCFIERNPVVYVQSLTHLHHLWSSSRSATPKPTESKTPCKRVVVNPLPESWASGSSVRQLASYLEAHTALHGFDLHRSQVLNAVEDASIFHYHGHAFYDPVDPLETYLPLNETLYNYAVGVAAGRSRIRKPADCQSLSARDVIDNVKLQNSALATIIACASGVAAVSSTDDVLGLPTSLFYAGASAVVSALWPVDDIDGVSVATKFYSAILEAMEKTTSVRSAALGTVEGGGAPSSQPMIPLEAAVYDQKESQQTGFVPVVDVARALQSAVLGLRREYSKAGQEAPYHWAAFTLQGFWLLPDVMFRASSTTHGT